MIDQKVRSIHFGVPPRIPYGVALIIRSNILSIHLDFLFLFIARLDASLLENELYCSDVEKGSHAGDIHCKFYLMKL